MAMASRILGSRLCLAASRYVVQRYAVAPVFAAASKGRSASGPLSHSRGFASKSQGDGALLKVLKSEIEHEKGDNENSGVKLKPPAPFTIQNKPGTQEVILRRTYNSEDIAITCVLRVSPYDEPIDEEEDDEESEQPVSQEEVHINVTISKGADEPVLEISCTCSQGELEIEKVSYLESKSSRDDEMAYSGPEFTELDEDLQKQFQKYLEARGINDEFCNYLVNYLPEKERQEYVRWLEKVESFIRK